MAVALTRCPPISSKPMCFSAYEPNFLAMTRLDYLGAIRIKTQSASRSLTVFRKVTRKTGTINVGFQREAATGLPVAVLCRRYAFSEAGFYL